MCVFLHLQNVSTCKPEQNNQTTKLEREKLVHSLRHASVYRVSRTDGRLVDFFDGWTFGSASRWSSARSTCSGESPRESPGARHSPAASSLVQLGDNRHTDFLQFLLFVLKLVFLSQLKHNINIARVRPVHAMNAARRQVPADLCSEPSRSAWNISPPVGCQLTTLSVTILLLLNPKADTHFAIPQRVGCWVDMGGWLHIEMVYLPADGHPSKY